MSHRFREGLVRERISKLDEALPLTETPVLAASKALDSITSQYSLTVPLPQEPPKLVEVSVESPGRSLDASPKHDPLSTKPLGGGLGVVSALGRPGRA